MKWIILPIAALSVGTHFVQGHQGHHGQGHDSAKHEHFQMVSQHLGLTSDQQEKLIAAVHGFLVSKKELFSNASLTDVKRHEALKRARSDAEKTIRAVLSQKQYKELSASGFLSHILGDHEMMMAMLRKLGLTTQQMDRVQKLMGNLHQTLLNMHGGGLTHEQAMARMKDTHEAAKREMHAILTPEQAKKLHEMMKTYHAPGTPHSSN